MPNDFPAAGPAVPRAAEAGGAGPAALYRERIAAGEIHADPAQERVVARSNRLPERLYENGLQRDRFLPFIALLGERLDSVELDSGRDYRLHRMRGRKVYHCPNDAAAQAALEAAFADLTDYGDIRGETLTVLGRALVVSRAGRNVAWFSFEELCARPLAAANYLALAERYAALIIDGIPRLSPRERNEAQRFHI